MRKYKPVHYERMLNYLLAGKTLTKQQAINKFRLRDGRYFDFLIFFAQLFGYKIYKIKVKNDNKNRGRYWSRKYVLAYRLAGR